MQEAISHLMQNWSSLEKYLPPSGQREYDWGQAVGRELQK
ncbi:MAG: hypothetical protein [Caudoviricetes sp.]|nr:MAG: hypothetical protein [Caudoviricetes sp.]